MGVAGYNSTVLIGSLPAVALTDEAMTSTDLTTYIITNQAHRYLDKKTPTVVQTSPDGSAWTTVTTGFTLYRSTARVVFASAQASGTQVRLHSGKYIPYSLLATANSADFSGKLDMLEDTVFSTTGEGAKTFVPGLMNGTLKLGGWWVNNSRAASLIARDLLIVGFTTPTGSRYEGFCLASDCDIKVDMKALVGQDLTFQLTDEFFAA
jgi:hypothetical protein